MATRRTISKEQILVLIQVVLNERDHCINLGKIGMTSDVEITDGLERVVFDIMGLPDDHNYVRDSDGDRSLGLEEFYYPVFGEPKNANESYEVLLRIKSEYRQVEEKKTSNF